ncbi:MAG: hypothetical protein A2096_07815 [Spirochaetes bacterium GWF1_41_5]|nr:MAG: hypothetical protein A2096_07815 [Spirochaetes bacterium GWF1_41_5]
MTGKERFLTAMMNQQSDMVPVCPDIGQQVVLKMKGRPFWDSYYYNDPELWQVYLEALKYFKFDGRFYYKGLDYVTDSQVKTERHVIKSDGNCMTVQTVHHTPAGDLDQEIVYFRDQAPAVTRGFIKDISADLEKYKYLFPKIVSYSDKSFRAMYDEIGDLGAVCMSIQVPGFHNWESIFNGGLPSVVYAEADYPEHIEELCRMQTEYIKQQIDCIMQARPDYIYLGSSGMLTLSSLEQVRKYCLPLVQYACAQAKKYNLPSMLHACGKSKALAGLFAEETDLNMINPLEAPPMGDAVLSEIKKLYGSKLALSGNILTTDVMLRGTPAQVKEACRKAIEDAGAGGGFALMTGDQCGRDTPEENIFAFVEAGRKYGRYN